jgi:hypothetical protein
VRDVQSSQPQRGAGVVAPAAMESFPTLPESADFTTTAAGDAFWMVGREATPTAELFVSSGARVLADLRAELGITTGDVAWTAGLLEALGDRAEATGRVRATLPAVREVVPADWLRLALWITYSAAEGSAGYPDVKLPSLVVLPAMGRVLVGATAPTRARLGFNPALLARDPFHTTPVGFDVTGHPGPRRRAVRAKGGGAAWLLAVGALAVAGGS